MQAVETIGRYISQGVYIVSGPFHPFGGAVDIIVVEQPDGTFKSSPWYVCFGKFQGVLKTKEKIVKICVNGVKADFHMYLNHKGQAYFLKEADEEEGESYEKFPSGGERGGHSWVMSGSRSFDSKGSTLRDAGNENIMARSRSCQSRASGLVSECRSMGTDGPRQQEVGVGVIRRGPLESAEIAAELLELNWSISFKFRKRLSPAFAPATFDSKIVNVDEKPSCKESLVHSNPESSLTDGPSHEEAASCNMSVQSVENTDFTVQCANGKLSYLNGIAEGIATSTGGSHILKEQTYGVHSFTVETSENLCASSKRSNQILHHDSTETRDVHPEAVLINNNSIAEEFMEMRHGDTITILETFDPVDTSITYGSVKQTESPSICSVSIFSGRISQAGQNSSTDETSKFQLSSETDNNNGSYCGFLLTKKPSFPTEDNSTGEFPLGGLDESKVSEVTPGEDITLVPVDKERNLSLNPQCFFETAGMLIYVKNELLVISDNFDRSIDAEYADERSRTISVSTEIARSGKTDETQLGHEAQSLPNMKSEFDNLDAHGWHYPLSHSLDLDSEFENLPLPNREDSDIRNTGVRNEEAPVSKQIQEQMGADAASPFPNGQLADDESSSLRLDPEHASKSVDGTDRDQTSPKPKYRKKMFRVNTPTSEQVASLNLREGSNTITFTFSTAMLGEQQVDCKIYLWKWSDRVIISDVDGTITKSDVLGQFMPLVGVDWSHTGVARLFSAIKENGYQLLFLSARSITQAYLTRQFLFNLKQDGNALPDGPVVISPDGIFPSLFREVVRRCPHEFKIACLEDIKSLFPSDCNPFYAGFGNRDTDEISYLKVGIPKGKIFIINPKGEVAVNHHVNTKSYTSIHALVNDMFPAMTSRSSPEQEDYNSWNFWKLPSPAIDI
ncbi:phosphatidate phosphatase PAH2-like isoform X2 [Rhodamnia argentea]|uniref:Phosphatidate phosphatase PAH2-like isoform X2 n=1 Tax=Rhodamnia argentea TaxID=178133 RepID=A0ABM3H3H6_9MYRT|nr:phosphatidate phosphatase PAH2-like isoform X2 [Rhodamnia argentea]